VHKDLVLIPDDQPGVLARIGQAVGDAGINIEAVSAFTGQGKGVIHLLFAQPEEAHRVLEEAGFDVRAARDVVVVDVKDEPGVLGAISKKLADAGINIEQAYIATNNRIVLVVDEIERARELLG
jgi:hypothetical protein